MRVYAVVGWFGDLEWIEGIYECEEDQEAEIARLWETRRSDNPRVPDYIQGLCKFGGEDFEVIGRRADAEEDHAAQPAHRGPEGD